MTQFRRSIEWMGAAGIRQYQKDRLRQAGMLSNPKPDIYFMGAAVKKGKKWGIKGLMYGTERSVKVDTGGLFKTKKQAEAAIHYLKEAAYDGLQKERYEYKVRKQRGKDEYAVDKHWGSKTLTGSRYFSGKVGKKDSNLVIGLTKRDAVMLAYYLDVVNKEAHITRVLGGQGFFNPRKKGNPRLKAVPKHLKDTDRGPPYVFPKRKSYPINDLFHARLALIYVMSPTNAPKRDKVINAVADRYPQYNWAAWWNQELKDPKHCRRENIKACPFLKTWSHYRNGGGRGSWEQSDPATKHRNPRHTDRLEEGISKQQFIIEDAGQALQYALEMGDMKGAKKYIGQIEKARLKLFDLSAALEGSQRGRSTLKRTKMEERAGWMPEYRKKEHRDAEALQKTRGRRAAKALSRNPGKAMKRRKNAEFVLGPTGEKLPLLVERTSSGYILVWVQALRGSHPNLPMSHSRTKDEKKAVREAKKWWKSISKNKSKKKSSSRRNPMPRKRPTRRKNAKTAMTKAEYRRFNAWRGWRKWELDEKYNDYKKRIKRETKGRKVTRTRKRRNPRMNRSEYMERLDNLHPRMSNPRKNSLWKKYSR